MTELPGLHQWDNPDIQFDKMIDLKEKCITMGPYTLVTVEEGYAAITIDNGKQMILDGGKSYMSDAQNCSHGKVFSAARFR